MQIIVVRHDPKAWRTGDQEAGRRAGLQSAIKPLWAVFCSMKLVVLWEWLSSRDYSATGLSRLESRSHNKKLYCRNTGAQRIIRPLVWRDTRKGS
jgi:hypothetical protein